MHRLLRVQRLLPVAARLSSSAAASARAVTDFMGAEMHASSPSTKLIIDNSILSIVTKNDDATAYLTEVTTNDPDAGMAWALLGFEYYRNTTPNLKAAHMLRVLDNLDRLSVEGKLCVREAQFGAALLSVVEGRYTTAAVLLEAAVQHYEYDLIAMRLAQECHMRAGDGHSSLRCVASRMPLYHESHEMQGHVLGMLAVGLIESGLYQEGEDAGLHAVASTKGADTNAVQAVLSSIHLSFKSMNLSRELIDYASDNSGPGRHPFSFLEGNFQLHQGNFNGALESFDLLLERSSDPSTRFLSSLSFATMLLLQIDMQVQHLAVDARWERLGGFWDTMPLGKGSIFATPMSEFCSALTYSRIMRRRVARGDQPLPPAVSDVKMSGIFSYFAPKKQNLEHEQSLATEKWETWINDTEMRADSDATSGSQAPRWQDAVRNRYGSLRAGASLPLEYPALLPDLPADYLTRDQRAEAMRSVVVPLAEAMDLFSREQYADSARRTAPLLPLLPRLGGDMPLRHSVHSAHIESLLRAGMYKEAKSLLNERVTMREYDAQSWFQLSSAALHLGEEDLAKMAYMRAWQFGHRRAGSEGPLQRM